MTLHSLVIQKLLSTNAHMGRRVTEHHFKIYTYGLRNKLTIIDSDKTLICLRNALDFIASLTRRNARLSFVNTNPLFDDIVEHMTRKIGLYSPSSNLVWRQGGWLTNRNSPKKFRSRNKKICFTPSQPPDCVVVIDTERKASVILEAEKLNIPVVALVDSSMPLSLFQRIAYPIPANDSVQFVYLFCNMITKTFLLEKKKAGVKTMNEKDDEEETIREETKVLENSEVKSDIFDDELLIIPYGSLPALPNDSTEIKKLLDKLVILKFNGSLGTAIGFNGPKASLEIRDGFTSLDLIVNQLQFLSSKYGCNIPLLLMNTDETHDDTLELLENYSQSNIDFHTFNQSQLSKESSSIMQTGKDELSSSDHSAVFLSLMKSATLDLLLSQGKEYILVVDSDNVAAEIDPKTLSHLAQSNIDYCMEVTQTPASGLSSNILSQSEGKFRLVEIARNPAKHVIEKFKLAATGSLWANLKAIKRLADTDKLKMENLPVPKVDGDKDLMRETVAGSTIRLFDRAIGLNVPGSRFHPVNTTSDLLLLQSDLYTSDEGFLVRNPARKNPVNPVIDLGPEFRMVSDLQNRFKSIPSMVDLDSLKVTGNVWFGSGITLKGRVTILAKPGVKLEITDGVTLENKEIKDFADI